MRQTINGAELRRMIISAAASIEIHKQALNELNVFPVPDGDTGTNMSMTINSAAADLRKAEDPELYAASKIAASAMLRGARGNSGVILSLLMRGISKTLKGHEVCDGVLWANALQGGVDAAYKAVMKPTEGTILTVARLAAAKAAEAAQENNFIEFVQAAAIEEAKVALANTVNQNPVLKKAGVVDAGGKGWLLALEAMMCALKGEDVVAPEGGAVGEVKEQADFSDFNTEDITFTYCTEFIISRENQNDPEKLREFLSSIGDSLVLVDDDEIIKVHVHTNDPGRALHEAIEYGSFVTVKVENMRLQHTEKVMSEKELAPKIAEPTKPIGVVSVCAGDGLADVFTNLGTDAIISGGQTMNPATEDILAAIQSVPAKTVFVLPNNKNIIMAAEQAQKLADRQVIVLPTRTVPMGITALLNFDPSANAETNTINMMAAADKVSTGLITYAARDSEFDGKRIRKGEIMALENGKIVATSTDLTKATYRLARSMCKKDSSFVTIISGCDVSDEEAEKLTEIVKAKCPNHVEVSHIRGGQPVYYYMISVE